MAPNYGSDEMLFQNYHLMAYMKIDPRRIPLQEPDRRHVVTWLQQLAHDIERHQEDPSVLYGLGTNGEAT